jgi:hypothetical protein
VYVCPRQVFASGSAVKWTCDPPSAMPLVAQGSALGVCDDGACNGKRGTDYVVQHRPCVCRRAWARSAGTALPLRSGLFTGECGR